MMDNKPENSEVLGEQVKNNRYFWIGQPIRHVQLVGQQRYLQVGRNRPVFIGDHGAIFHGLGGAGKRDSRLTVDWIWHYDDFQTATLAAYLDFECLELALSWWQRRPNVARIVEICRWDFNADGHRQLNFYLNIDPAFLCDAFRVE